MALFTWQIIMLTPFWYSKQGSRAFTRILVQVTSMLVNGEITGKRCAVIVILCADMLMLFAHISVDLISHCLLFYISCLSPSLRAAGSVECGML